MMMSVVIVRLAATEIVPTTLGANTIVSVPAVTLACSTAARSVHTAAAVAQALSAVLASGASPLSFTVKVVDARTAGGANAIATRLIAARAIAPPSAKVRGAGMLRSFRRRMSTS